MLHFSSILFERAGVFRLSPKQGGKKRKIGNVCRCTQKCDFPTLYIMNITAVPARRPDRKKRPGGAACRSPDDPPPHRGTTGRLPDCPAAPSPNIPQQNSRKLPPKPIYYGLFRVCYSFLTLRANLLKWGWGGDIMQSKARGVVLGTRQTVGAQGLAAFRPNLEGGILA